MYKELLIASKQKFIVMVIIFVVSAVLALSGGFYRHNEYDRTQIAKKDLQSMMAKYQLAKKNSELIKQYKSKYEWLNSKGIIESEDRLSWVNTMETAVNKKLITSVQYKIGKQEIYKDPALASVFPDIDVFISSMSIEMELLHEGDLYSFINELKKSAKGLFEIKSCELSAMAKTAEAILESVTDRNLKARCNINWYNIRPRGA